MGWQCLFSAGIERISFNLKMSIGVLAFGQIGFFSRKQSAMVKLPFHFKSEQKG
ncbi:hypothetical protein Z946_3370 [Sulfitobacter noctilucicola]|nr:hypothetical protein Z946_3370 [Sulfitobacter noctilucicola]